MMFDLSKKIDYGLDLMIFLAKNRNGPIPLREIAKKRKLPFKSLEQVAIPLRGAGLIDAKEGRSGGYSLVKKPKQISIAEVVEILEGPVQVGACFGCPQAAMCAQKDVWSEVGDKVRETIKDKKLSDLIK